MSKTKTILRIFLVIISASNVCWARSDIDNRVTRLENIVENEYNSKLLEQIDTLQQEVRELRGKLEEQQNATNTLNQKQDKLFLNLDQRINKIDPAAPATVSTPIATTEPAATTAAPVTATEPASIDTPIAIPDVSINATPKTPEAVQPTMAEVPGTNERTLYEAASTLMRNKKFAEAILEFKDLLWQFPEGTYASDSYYWLGELYRMQWHANRADKNLLNHAKDAFNIVINKYQGQEREGDALLKLALLEMDQDHLAVAKEILQQVVKKFPNSARSRIAETNIVRIDRARIEN